MFSVFDSYGLPVFGLGFIRLSGNGKCSGHAEDAESGHVETAGGVPIGHPDFVKAQAANRLDAEADLLRQLVQLPDVQCAWLLLAFCAAPRAQHLLRNVPPADILPYARGHDDAVWAVVEGLLGDQGPGEGEDWAAARQVAFLPPSLRPRFLCSGAGFTGSILGGVGRCAPGVARANRQRPAYVQQWRRRAKLLQRAGRADRSGRLAPVAPTRQPLRVNSAWETQVGSDTPFSHFTLPFENACCFLPWLRPLAPSFTLSPVRTLVCGLRQFLRTQPPPLRPTSCTSQ